MTWPTVPFAEVLTDSSGGNPKVQQSEYSDSGDYPIVDQGAKQVAGYINDANLLANVDLPAIIFGDHTRRFKFVNEPFAVGADGVKILRPSEVADPKYLFHYLRSIELPNAGYSRHFKFLKEISIPLPPLPEQRRIASILDQADALRAMRRRAFFLIDALETSAFLHSFTRSENVTAKRLGDVAETTSGGTPSRRVALNFGGSIPWVKSGEVAQGIVLCTEESITQLGLESSSAKVMPAGTVLVAMYGATAGEVGQLGIEAATNQAVCCITPGAKFTTAFLVATLKSQRSKLKGMAVGGAQPNLSQGQLRSIEVPVPPIELQEKFASTTYGIDSLRLDAEKHFSHLDELFASLQSRAFKGEL